MLFNSYSFILAFLPATLAGYFVLREFGSRFATLVWLTLASLVFYAMWEPRNLLVLLVSVAVNFYCGSALAERAWRGEPTRPLLAGAVAFNLALIGYFKYVGFFTVNLNTALGADLPVLQPILPLAISFFTFQQIAYLVDSATGETRGYTFVHYILMVTFFPQLIAGPIVIHRTLIGQFASPRGMAVSESLFALGLGFFVFGLAKKVLLADTMAPQVDLVFNSAANGATLSFAEAWTGALAYTLQLYFDFSGYSDMAIGLGLVFGVRLPLNFNSPYKATSIVDFWRRWHMTLSAFLRDYLYVALGGNRRGEPRRYANVFVTMLLGGLWHGAGWTFVIWGALHGAALALCHFWRALRGAPRETSIIGTWLARGATLLFIVFGWVIFRADSMANALSIMGTMIGLNGLGLGLDLVPRGAAMLTAIAALAGLALFAPNSQEWLGYAPDGSPVEERSWAVRLSCHPLHGAALACVLVFTLTQMSAVQAFLYFQF